MRRLDREQRSVLWGCAIILAALLALVVPSAFAQSPTYVTLSCTTTPWGTADPTLTALAADAYARRGYRFEVIGADSNFWTNTPQPLATCQFTAALPDCQSRAEVTAEVAGHAVGAMALAKFRLQGGQLIVLSQSGGLSFSTAAAAPPAPGS